MACTRSHQSGNNRRHNNLPSAQHVPKCSCGIQKHAAWLHAGRLHASTGRYYLIVTCWQGKPP